MADYREISQAYAREAIKAAMLINAGAAVALLTQATDLLDKGLAGGAANAMIWWASGLLLASFTWVLAFASTRFVDKSEREGLPRHLVTSDRYMISSIFIILASLWCFASGCITLACAFSIIATNS